MNICDLVTGAKRLQKATKLLKEKWVETRGHWNDQTAQQFEQQFLQPLGERVNLTLGAVGRLAEVLQKAEQELSDRGPGFD
jgi:hypothetical protein